MKYEVELARFIFANTINHMNILIMLIFLLENVYLTPNVEW